jgi:hypothetical protein
VTSDISAEANEPDWSFDPSGGVACGGRLWLHDHSCRSLLTVDLSTLIVDVAIELESEPPEEPWREGYVSPPPLLVTEHAVWLSCPPGMLRRIDVSNVAITTIHTSLTCAWLASNRTAIFGYDQSSREVLRLSDDGQAVIRKATDGYVQQVAASDRYVWLRDLTAGVVVCLDAATLETVNRIDLRVGHTRQLFAHGDDAIAIHDGSSEEDILMGPNGIADTYQVLRLSAQGSVAHVGDVGWWQTLAVDRRTLWLGQDQDTPGAIDEWRDPVGELSRFDLFTGEQTPVVLTTAGQVDEIKPVGDLLFVSGFVRTKQTTDLLAIDLQNDSRQLIGLADLALRFDDSQQPIEEPSLPREEVLAALPDRIRQALTGSTRTFDANTGEWYDSGSSIDHRFRLREVMVGHDPIRVAITFEWTDEVGTLFGFEFDEPFLEADRGFGEGLENASSDIWLYVMEETDTGIMKHGHRLPRDGVTWIS